MSKNDRRKQALFDAFAANLEASRRLFSPLPFPAGSYVCPLCYTAFDRACLDHPEVLTLEHSIPQSLGGGNGTATLTCKSCNNESGRLFDSQVGNLLEMQDGTVETFEYTYAGRANGVRGDATGGAGDAPNELLQTKGVLPMSQDSFFVFSKQGKNDLYVNYEQALFKDDAADPYKFSYPADHPLTPEFEEQMTALVRDYTGDGEYLAVHHPEDVPNAKDDAPDATALGLLAAARGKVGEIVFL